MPIYTRWGDNNIMSKQAKLETLKRIDQALSKTVQNICIALLVAIVATVSIAVFTRFVIFYPLNFSDALAKYMMMWMAFLGSGLAIRAGEHIAVDMFVSKIKGSSKKKLLIIMNILVSIFLIAVTYYGFQNAWNGKDSHDPFVFGISMMIPYLSVPVGALYALIQMNLTTLIRLYTEDA